MHFSLLRKIHRWQGRKFPALPKSRLQEPLGNCLSEAQLRLRRDWTAKAADVQGEDFLNFVGLKSFSQANLLHRCVFRENSWLLSRLDPSWSSDFSSAINQKVKRSPVNTFVLYARSARVLPIIIAMVGIMGGVWSWVWPRFLLRILNKSLHS